MCVYTPLKRWQRKPKNFARLITNLLPGMYYNGHNANKRHWGVDTQ